MVWVVDVANPLVIGPTSMRPVGATGATVSIAWLNSTAPARGTALPATSVNVEVLAIFKSMLPEATLALGVTTTL